MRQFFLISLAIIFITCKKDDSNNTPPPVTTVGDSCVDNRPMINVQLNPVASLNYLESGLIPLSVGNKIVLVSQSNFDGGKGVVYIYDVTTNSLNTINHYNGLTGFAVGILGNKIFIAGGADGWGFADSTVGIYDLSTGLWSYSYLSVPRANAAVVAVGDKLLFAGGNKGYWNSELSTVDIYDQTTNSWSSANLSIARTGITALAADGKAYFSGGFEILEKPSTRVDVYNSQNKSWSSFQMNEKKARMAGIVKDNKIFWAGGETNNTGSSRKIEIYDILNQTSTFACLHRSNLDFNAAIKDDNIVFFTGNNNNGQTIDILNTTTNKWAIGKLPFNIRSSAIMSVNNTIYVAGGLNNTTAYDKIWKLEW